MTSEDTKELLSNIDRHLDRLDKTHIKQLYNMLMSVCCKEQVLHDDGRRILALLMMYASKLRKQDIKKLYKIAIRYNLNPKCFACNQPISHIRDFSWDHLYPQSKGGSDELHNLVPMHKSCNSDKGDSVIEIVISEDYSICFDADVVVISVEDEKDNHHGRKPKKRNVVRFRPWHGYVLMHGHKCNKKR